MRTSFLITLLACVVGCAAEKKADGGADSGATTSTASPSTDSTPTAPSPTAAAWTVTPGGVGRIQAGMTVEELRGVAGDVTLPSGGSAACTYVHPSAVPRGVSVMLAGGRVARVDVDSSGVQSDAGISVGDSASKVSRAYAGRVTTMPHKYVTGGQYLEVRSASPADSALRIVFESEGGRITRFRSGRVPEVQFVERCG